MLSRRDSGNRNPSSFEMSEAVQPLTVVARQNIAKYDDRSIQMFEGGATLE
jgi:hypothetical protein